MIIDENELQFGELRYEQRIVSYFDILGWRQEIENAGSDPSKIARLASIPRMFHFVAMANSERIKGAHISAFSDNVVVSVPYEVDRIQPTVRALARIQLGIACMGFWTRGAITIGSLYHDDHVVFGPALNRAYELESKHAIYPRTLFDSLIPELAEVQGDFIGYEDEAKFTDPFNPSFVEWSIKENNVPHELLSDYSKAASLRLPKRSSWILSGVILEAILNRVRIEMISASKLSVWQKHAWLFDRIAHRISWPERSSDLLPPKFGE